MSSAEIFFKNGDKDTVTYSKWILNPASSNDFEYCIGFHYQNSIILYDLERINHIKLEDGSILKLFHDTEKGFGKRLDVWTPKADVDPRTDEQKEKAQFLADGLRTLADIVEKSIIREPGVTLDFNQGHVEQVVDYWVHKYTDGDQHIKIEFDLYNPDMDKRSEYLEDLKKSDLT